MVYRCYQTSLRRSVAIKVLASEIGEDSRERFLREGYAMGGLSGHPNIVNILQVGVTVSDRPYIVMPYYAADSLGQRLHRVGPIQWPEALRIGVKLCGALETAHRTGTLHRDIKPGNVLVNDYGEPQLSDFGIAHIAGGYETATGFFTGTIAYSAPEVLAGNPPTVAADIYSLGATLYALIAGNAAHERNTGEDLIIAHYLRVTSTPVQDMRLDGIPADVCVSIEKAMSLDPAKRQASAAEFGRQLQAAQRRNGLSPDSMALSRAGETGSTLDMPAIPQTEDAVRTDESKKTSIPRSEQAGVIQTPVAGPAGIPWQPQEPGGPASAMQAASPPGHPGTRPVPVWGREPSPRPLQPPPLAGFLHLPKKRKRTRVLFVAGAAVAALLLVLGGVYFLGPRDSSDGIGSGTEPTTEAQAVWQPIANARVARAAVAATQADGTIWIFGGIRADGVVSGRHEGYDPPIDAWKAGEDLPVPVRHAMSVTWQDTPVVLGGWRSSGGAGTKVATDRVWRVVNGRWVELPHMLQPRAAAAAAVVLDRIIVTGGVDVNGALLNSTEIFDGNSWTLGAGLPTPRQRLAAASDDKLVYAVGGTNGTSDLRSVEAYDPVANNWTALPDLPQARSDLGMAIADGRLLAVGGVSAGQVLKSVAALDLLTLTWTDLPDMGTARQGMAVAAVANSVYAIGGSTGVGDREVTSSAEALKLAARKAQPASQWRSLPDAPTARLMTAWTVLEDKVWIAGGLRQGTALRTVASYDPATGAWQSEPSLPVPLHHATTATYRGEVVVIGGASDDLAFASDKVFALRAGDWGGATQPQARSGGCCGGGGW